VTIKQNKAMTWAGWIIAGLLALLLTFSAVMKFQYGPEMKKGWEEEFEYPAALATTIGIVELSCLVLYLYPRTAVLGAVLLTGYLGGAVATHARVEDLADRRRHFGLASAIPARPADPRAFAVSRSLNQ